MANSCLCNIVVHVNIIHINGVQDYNVFSLNSGHMFELTSNYEEF